MSVVLLPIGYIGIVMFGCIILNTTSYREDSQCSCQHSSDVTLSPLIIHAEPWRYRLIGHCRAQLATEYIWRLIFDNWFQFKVAWWFYQIYVYIYIYIYVQYNTINNMYIFMEYIHNIYIYTYLYLYIYIFL